MILRAPAPAGALPLLLLLAAAAPLATATPSAAARTIPPPPARFVNDAAGVLSPAAAARIDATLEAFETKQGSQVLIAIYQRLPEDEALEAYTHDVAEAWKVGRDKEDDGVVLFAFIDDRALRLEVGYGLEGALTDLESKQILEGTMIPFLLQGDWDGGVEAGANAIIASIEGEYTATPGRRGAGSEVGGRFVFFVILFVFILLVISARRQRRGRWKSWTGGFSGGGGSFGGGGASARW